MLQVCRQVWHSLVGYAQAVGTPTLLDYSAAEEAPCKTDRARAFAVLPGCVVAVGPDARQLA